MKLSMYECRHYIIFYIHLFCNSVLKIMINFIFSSKIAVFRFAHAETTLPLLSLLGLFRDNNLLLAKNFHQNKNRVFRTSRMAPFSTNIGFVLLDCLAKTGEDDDEEDNDDDEEGDSDGDENDDDMKERPLKNRRYKVQMLLNELPVRLPFCKSDICSLSTLRRNLHKYVEQCNFRSMCRVNKDEL